MPPSSPTPYAIGTSPINLTQLLKRVGWAETGGQAKIWIDEGLVLVNGVVETRKRRQMQLGDTLAVDLEGAPGPIQLVQELGEASTNPPPDRTLPQ